MVDDNNKRLLQALLNKKIITSEQLTQALARQKETKANLEDILVALNFIGQEELDRLKEKESSDDKSFLGRIDRQVLKLVPETIARRYSIIPVSKRGNILTLAMTDVDDVVTIDTVRTISGCEIEPIPAREKDIMTAVERYYSGSPDMETVLLDLVKVNASVTKTEVTEDLTQVKLKANDPPVVKFVNLLLLDAIERRASDIHIEPAKEEISIRIRVDGVLQKVTPPPRGMYAAIISRVKILANLDIAERRLPQDGRCSIRVGDKEVDVRVSTFPTMYGEKAVLRLLDKEQVLLGLEELGLLPDQLSKLERAIKRPYGMILETGPTGSGKTTTLYTSLRYINKPGKNIVTIEDPIEYDLPGINQTQVKPEIGLNFARGLRALLRQDPDVILVGEIRDRETAQIAMRAALTGHLVFSTLHTNDAVGAIAQLHYFGIEPYLIGSAVDLIIAQRLIRRVCFNCREYYELSENILHNFGLKHLKKNEFKLVRGRGCRQCNHTGYFGRTAIFQFFEINPRVKELIFQGADMHTLRAEATRQGMRTLRQSALEKLAQGMTTLEEVLSVTLEE